MKKVVLTLVLGLFFVAFTSAQNTKDIKEEVKLEVASNDVVYKCPMKCEGDKTYKKAGQCPVCKMDLKSGNSSCKEKGKAECKGKKEGESCKGKEKSECKGKKEGKSCKEKGKAECKEKKEGESCKGKEKSECKGKKDKKEI